MKTRYAFSGCYASVADITDGRICKQLPAPSLCVHVEGDAVVVVMKSDDGTSTRATLHVTDLDEVLARAKALAGRQALN